MFPNFTISFVALDARLEMRILVFGKSVLGLFLANPKPWMTLFAISVLLTSTDSTSETDLIGLHLNYVGFHVSNNHMD